MRAKHEIDSIWRHLGRSQRCYRRNVSVNYHRNPGKPLPEKRPSWRICQTPPTLKGSPITSFPTSGGCTAHYAGLFWSGPDRRSALRLCPPPQRQVFLSGSKHTGAGGRISYPISPTPKNVIPAVFMAQAASTPVNIPVIACSLVMAGSFARFFVPPLPRLRLCIFP